MSIVTISIAGRVHTVACDDGQEARIEKLGQKLDQRAQELLRSVGSGVGDGRLLVMLGLLLADESEEMRLGVERMQTEVESLNVELERARGEVHRLSVHAQRQAEMIASQQNSAQDTKAIDRKLADIVIKVANRVESIAEGIENV